MCTTTLVKSVDQFVLGVGVGLRVANGKAYHEM